MKHQLKIGFATQDITPELPVCLCGQLFVRKADQILDPLTATAWAVDNGDDSLIWLSCDLALFPDTVIPAIRAQVKQLEPAISPDKIVVSATHTHTAPYLSNMWHTTFPEVATTPETYHDLVVKQAAKTIVEAWNCRKEGQLSFGFDYAVCAHQRRMTYFHDINSRDDIWQVGAKFESDAAMYGPLATPEFAGFEGCPDYRVDFVFSYHPTGQGVSCQPTTCSKTAADTAPCRASSEPVGVAIFLPCPAQATEWLSEVSADFWHEFRQMARSKYGKDFQILPVCAACGDLTPRAQLQKESESAMLNAKGTTNRAEIAARIFNAMENVLAYSSKQKSAELPLIHQCWIQHLSAQQITLQEYETIQKGLARFAQGDVPPELKDTEPKKVKSIQECKTFRARSVMERYDHPRNTIPVELHIIRLGDYAFATFPQELFVDFASRIKARSKAASTVIPQLTGLGPHGYLATAKAQQGGGYSASCYCNTISPDGGQQFVDSALAAIEKMF